MILFLIALLADVDKHFSKYRAFEPQNEADSPLPRRFDHRIAP